jgi:predicted amidohydrolase YtcJ
MPADTILHNAKIATNSDPSLVEELAIEKGKSSAIGRDDEILRLRGPETKVINGNGRTVIPGLNDSHMHPIRGGLNYNMELRWDGVPSLAVALRMLKNQVLRTPPLNEYVLLAVGQNSNSQNGVCRPWKKSIRQGLPVQLEE